MQRIAVWNTAFLGDAVLTLPLIQSLRLRYPDALIDVFVRDGFESLFSHHPDISHVYGFDKRCRHKGPAALLQYGRELRRRSYHLWISAHSSPRSGLIALLSRAQRRIGYDKPFANRLFYTDLVDRRFSERDEIERLLALLLPLGAGAVSDWPKLHLGPEERQTAEAFFSSLQGPFLGMHPGSVWGTKRWPAGYFAAIGSKALRQGAQILVFAGPGEEEVAHAVCSEMAAACSPEQTARLHNLAGRLSLPMLAAYLGRLSCYLTNDSGPMHLAWPQHTPVTAIFGPTVRSLGFFPRGAAATVVEADLPCRPCGLHGPQACPLKHHHCMVHVTPDMVWPDVRRKLWPAS